MAFELSVETAPVWVDAHGLNPTHAELAARELTGGVSSSVVAVIGRNVGVVLKQALSRLRVADVWEASVDRSASEATALRIVDELTPNTIPRVLLDHPEDHVIALELLPSSARNWQAEIADHRVHPELGAWAGSTLGRWHSRTTASGLEPVLDGFETFEQLRLVPFHEAVMSRRPELARAIAPYVAELRSERKCLVDGDYAPKNMLVQPSGRCWKIDLEVAHIGNPAFDVSFFLSFLVLSAIRWPELHTELRTLGATFLHAYHAIAGERFAGDDRSLTGHTACLMLARTDGLSPAPFLDEQSRDHAREAAIELLCNPEDGLWSWT